MSALLSKGVIHVRRMTPFFIRFFAVIRLGAIQMPLTVQNFLKLIFGFIRAAWMGATKGEAALQIRVLLVQYQYSYVLKDEEIS